MIFRGAYAFIVAATFSHAADFSDPAPPRVAEMKAGAEPKADSFDRLSFHAAPKQTAKASVASTTSTTVETKPVAMKQKEAPRTNGAYHVKASPSVRHLARKLGIDQ